MNEGMVWIAWAELVLYILLGGSVLIAGLILSIRRDGGQDRPPMGWPDGPTAPLPKAPPAPLPSPPTRDDRRTPGVSCPGRADTRCPVCGMMTLAARRPGVDYCRVCRTYQRDDAAGGGRVVDVWS